MSSGFADVPEDNFLFFTKGLPEEDVRHIVNILKDGRNPVRIEELIGVCLKGKDEQLRLYQEWKQRMYLKDVKKILGPGVMNDDDLARLLTTLKDPTIRADFGRWCDMTLVSDKNWPDDYVFDEARKLLSPPVKEKVPEVHDTLVEDGFVRIPPSAPEVQERSSSLPKEDTQQPPPENRLPSDSLVGNDSLAEGSSLKTQQRGIKMSTGGRGTKLTGHISTKGKKAPTQTENEHESEEEEAPKKKKVLPQDGLGTYNILVVGDSGVGKTTFINGLANYLDYSTWEENLENGPNVRIATQFTILNMENQPVTVRSKSSFETTKDERQNENLGAKGESVTQKPITHTFLVEREKRAINVNVIDTPGMNDTRGAKQDQLNLQKIIEHIRGLKQLNAIVLLLTADQPRMTLQFRASLNELLTHFDKNSLKNLLFCYTRTRSYNYQPADGLDTLREFISEQTRRSGVDIPIEKGNIFCIDNDCFRYLCLVDRFPDCKSKKMNKEFEECWSRTRGELFRLLKRVGEMKPYKLDGTADLSKLRQMIDALAQPQKEIAKLNASCFRVIENIFSEMQEKYNKSDNLAPRQQEQLEELLKGLKHYQEKQEEMKKDRQVILDLCAEIRLHIAYKSLTTPPDEFRLQLIKYLEEAESELNHGGDPRLVKDLQNVLQNYEEKYLEISKEVEDKKRNILTEYEIEQRIRGLQSLENYQTILKKTISFH